MLIYEGIKQEFQREMELDNIPALLERILDQKLNMHVSNQEVLSWRNSTQFMYKVLNDEEIPNDCGIAIEYMIPGTGKRVDFMISGYDAEQKGSAVIIELKQWTHIEPVLHCDAIIKPTVETFVAKATRMVVHPSYQAWSYARNIIDYNNNIIEKGITLYPCAYLHNYNLEEERGILHPIYQECIEKSPVFTQGEIPKLRTFIKTYLHQGDNKEILYEIEKGRVVPSKSLQNHVTSMMQGNQEFILLDEQKVIYEDILRLARKCKVDGKKRVVIAYGGSGTGKSVIAINVLAKLLTENIMCQYVTKNAAPRNVFKAKLAGNLSGDRIQSLFTSSDNFYRLEKNVLDVVLVDEAHRLRKLSGIFANQGENQIKEIIHASLLSVFFLDPCQKVTYRDFGSSSEIEKQAKQQKAMTSEYKLYSQFRCNGSDGYIAWIKHLLGMENTANFDFGSFDYDFQLFDDPNDVRNAIIEKNKQQDKSRMVAGYCWEWEKASRKNKEIHDVKIGDFEMSWNLDGNDPFAISAGSIDQIGCIHTVQGLEFDYVGVIIGEDLRYEQGLITDASKRAKTDKSLFGLKKDYKSDPQEMDRIAREIILNTYYTLLGRGLKGCYVYCCDAGLQEYIRSNMYLLKD